MSHPSFPVRFLRGIARIFFLESAARRVYHSLQPSRSGGNQRPPSETSKCRVRLAPYCIGYGLDVGFGGDPIVPHAISVDMPQPYSDVGQLPVQLGGNAAQLPWFRDNVLDFIFSSHLLEDFHDTAAVLKEWMRVLKPGGRLIIFCPDEQVYRRHCAATGQPYNQHHVHADFSLQFAKDALTRSDIPFRLLHENPLVDTYSWELVVEKITK